MAVKELQLYLWESDIQKVEELNKEEKVAKMKKQIRAAFHILDKVSKKVEEKTP